MTSAVEATTGSTVNWRTVVFGGAKLGVVTGIGVVAVAFLARSLAGTVETIVLSGLMVLGVVVFAYVPALLLRPREVDTIAWVAMIGLMGSLFFTLIDVVILRPIDLYSPRWDMIGGGSGFWYIPVWWMGSAVLAWLGAWVVANESRTREAAIPTLAVKTAAGAVVVSGIVVATGLVPFTPAGVALGATIALILHVPLSSIMGRG